MKRYRIDPIRIAPPRDGFLIHTPDGRYLHDVRPIGIVRELNRLMDRIKQLETQVDEMMADNCYKETHE